MNWLVQTSRYLLEWKLPAQHFESQLAGKLLLTIDGVRFMLAFFAACSCGVILRRLESVAGALPALHSQK
jgi:hypothetical protein